MDERLLAVAAVVKIVGFSRRTLYSEISRGAFPKPVQISKRRVGWRESDLRSWLNARVGA